jgi:zinc transport system substrate-binding protein
VTHTHGPRGEHSHEGLDGHTWVDPVNAKVQAGVVRDRLLVMYPDEAGAIQGRYAELSRDLDGIDAGLREVTAALAGRALLASHPAYNYPAKRYRWNVTNLDLDPDAALDDAAIKEIAAKAAESGARIMLWEAEPREETVKRLKEELGVQSVVFSPAESPGEAERAAGQDYITIMRGNVERLKSAVAGLGEAGSGVR